MPNLTNTLIKSTPGPVMLTDSQSPLQVRITKTGHVSFSVRITKSGKRTRVTLGDAATLSLTQARKAASDLVATTRLEAAGAVIATAPAAAPSPTVAQAIKDYLKHKQQLVRPGTYRAIKASLAHVEASLGASLVREVTPATASRALAGKTTTVAFRAKKNCQTMWTWLQSHDLADKNPWYAVAVKTPAPRDVVLTLEQLVVLWEAAEYGPAGDAVRYAIATGARRNEITSLKWQHVGSEWITLPPELTKTHQTYYWYITPAVREALGRRGPDDSYVFHSSTSIYTKTRRIELIHKDLSQALGLDPAEWRLADIRKSVVSLLIDAAAVSPAEADALLNHAPSTISSVGRIYQRSAMNEQRKAAAMAWSKLLKKPTWQMLKAI